VTRTYGLIGTRPDIGGALARAQLNAIWPGSERRTSWGFGFFEKDEVLLERGPGGPETSLLSNIRRARSHAFLLQECDDEKPPSSESTPPLRFGNILFATQGGVEPVRLLMGPVKVLLPEFLTRSVRGETFTELAFALFLSELPAGSLARSRLEEPRRSADPLQGNDLKAALRRTLTTLDKLCKAHGLEAFVGDLWIHTGELMMVAHRAGGLALQVIRGAKDLAHVNALGLTPPHGLDQCQFVALCALPEQLSGGWERLPDRVLLTAGRGAPPLTESL
jgi:hypothetical protein